MRICSKLLSIKQKEGYTCFITNEVEVRVWFLTDEIIRIRAGFDEEFAEESYSLMLTGWDDRLDSFWSEERTRIEPFLPLMQELEDSVILHGEKLDLVITKEPFQIAIYDKEGTLLHRDVAYMPYKEDSNRRRVHASEIFEGDHFYGFGEKTGNLNKYGKYMSMSPTDAFGYDPKETDSLYKHIPFYIRLNDISQKAVGYFYHNTYECDFDMGRRFSGYWGKYSAYRADGGDIDLFFIAGPTIKEVVKRYTDLTGKSAMLPKSALGYLGSSMYYSELPQDSDDAILEFVDTARLEQIPISGYQLSSGYTAQDTIEGSKRCVFTWNNLRFKEPKQFFAEMKNRGVVVSPNVKPGILLTHPRIEEFLAEVIFVKDSVTE